MARELARAPWFVLSLVLHAVLLLLLSWFNKPSPIGQGGTASAQILLNDVDADIQLEAVPDEVVEIESNDMSEATTEPETEARYLPDSEPELAFEREAFTEGLDLIGLSAVRGSKNKAGGAGEDIFGLGSDALRKGTLRGTVAKLRDSGLEIVFVFDSTGSMDRVLDGAKRRIFRMVEVLHELVPRARIGIVTYRDQGKAEDYVTRGVPVTHDVYRVMNFMHTIQAGGGGDTEEAVLEGIKVATTQRWQPDSRRVVVLIGDAAPHKSDEAGLRNVVQAFTRTRAFVHTIATPDTSRTNRANPETQRTFQSIARDGKGQYSVLEAEDAVLQQVLSLAFGTDSRRDLDEVYALVEKQARRTDVAALDAVQRGDLGAIDRALRREPVDDDVIKAAIMMRNPTVTSFLVEKLGDQSFPPHGRQACSFAVMQILELRRPALDPEADVALRPREVEALLRRAAR